MTYSRLGGFESKDESSITKSVSGAPLEDTPAPPQLGMRSPPSAIPNPLYHKLPRSSTIPVYTNIGTSKLVMSSMLSFPAEEIGNNIQGKRKQPIVVGSITHGVSPSQGIFFFFLWGRGGMRELKGNCNHYPKVVNNGDRVSNPLSYYLLLVRVGSRPTVTVTVTVQIILGASK